MDSKYIDALLGTLKAQRDAALDEAARLNASLVVAIAERDAARKAAESGPEAGLDAQVVSSALSEARERMSSVVGGAEFAPSSTDPLGQGPLGILEQMASKLGLQL